MGKAPKRQSRQGRARAGAGSPAGGADVHYLERRLAKLLMAARDAEHDLIDSARYPDPEALASARNFAGYLGIRRHDLRKIQRGLQEMGLSSLGHVETDVKGSLQRVSAVLASLRGVRVQVHRETHGARTGQEILADRTSALLGPDPEARTARVMVTLPTAAADDYDLVRDLVAAGTGIVRITCAHDGPAVWERMIGHARRAAKELGRECRVMVDLAGPKLRTGRLEHGLAVLSWRPFRNSLGEVMEPAKIWLTAGAPAPKLAGATLPVEQGFLDALRCGDQIDFVDGRGRNRSVTVTEVRDGGAWGEALKRAYITEGTRLTVSREGSEPFDGLVGPITAVPRRLSLKVGDSLVLTRGEVPGTAAVHDSEGRLVAPASIGCTLPEVFRDARVGQRVFFDDGKMSGAIESVSADEIHVRITWARSATATLAEEKGINLPDTNLAVSAVTEKDVEDLSFFLRNPSCVDIVGMSFARTRQDLESFFETLEQLGGGDKSTLVKIENAEAFRRLPELVLEILRRGRSGVMIARGDLGVEVGFERMAELQEEILSLCAAAHIPVVWATEVLETLARKGMPSRAEVSDAVMAARAQCVMLNKGPHIRAAVTFLVDVLERMEGHQAGQARLLRKLSVADLPASGSQ